PKLVRPIGGESLLRRAVRLAQSARCAPVIVVLGRHGETYRDHLAGAGVHLVDNPEWAEGIGASLRRGVAALPPNQPPDATFLVLAPDQPRVTTDHLLALQATLQAQPTATAVASAYAGTIGVPVLFRDTWRARLASAGGEVGARRHLQRYLNEVVALPFPEGVNDIDTEADYAAIAGQ
ncbi:MAG: nucleotidyltransferase family protein, partial [Chloracidobacterium sp.]